jgi:exosortase/archaeosortase family protein
MAAWASGTPADRKRRPALAYLVRVAIAMAVFYGLLYFPYPPGSVPVRAISGYLRAVAAVSAAFIRLFDSGARARGDLIDGRFSMQIVLDCAALDAHALLAAAVLAFPARWRYRIAGVFAGALVVAAVNVVRIAILYVVGVRWPSAFPVVHEEVLQIAIILATFLVFGGWIALVRRSDLAARVPVAAP